jgi:hypothetical protein
MERRQFLSGMGAFRGSLDTKFEKSVGGAIEIVLLTLFFAFASRPAATAEFPKTGEAELIFDSTIHELLIVDGGSAGTIGEGDYVGVQRNVAGSGPFHDMSVRCMEGWRLLGGKRSISASCIWTDQDGDHVLSIAGGGHNELVSGSGKYTGITGSYQFISSTRLHETPGGVIPVITHIKATWEIK